MKGEEVKEVREMHNYGDCSFCGGKVKSDKVELVYQYRGKLYIFQNRYKNEELSYYCHTDHALPITHYPPKEIFEMTKAALITGISGQDGADLAKFLLDRQRLRSIWHLPQTLNAKLLAIAIFRHL